MMCHIVEHKMQQKAQGKDDDAIVVIDPHSDLVHGLMDLCPPDIADQVRVIDLGTRRGWLASTCSIRRCSGTGT